MHWQFPGDGMQEGLYILGCDCIDRPGAQRGLMCASMRLLSVAMVLGFFGRLARRSKSVGNAAMYASQSCATVGVWF